MLNPREQFLSTSLDTPPFTATTVPTDLQFLNELLHALTDTATLQEFVGRILELTLAYTRADNCSLMLLDPDAAHLRIAAARSRRAAPDRLYGQGTVFKLNEGIAGWVASSRSSIRVFDVAQDDRFVRLPYARIAIRSILCVPIVWREELLGVLNLSSTKPGAFSAADERLMNKASAPVAGGLVQFRNLQELMVSNEKLEQELSAQRADLAHRETLSSAGQLLAGLAHELNNPLTTILGYTELLEQTAGDDPNRASSLSRTISTEAVRCAKIVQSILKAVKPEAAAPNVFNANQIVSQAADLAQCELKFQNIQLHRGFWADALPWIRVSESELIQVLLNLINNASQAISGAGRTDGAITVSTRIVHDTVQIEVADDGPGVPETMRDQIFKAFFTTKPDGTGLGLSLCKDLVESNGGDLRLLQLAGAGAVFRASFPLVHVESEGTRVIDHRPRTIPDLALRSALIVDDESALSELVDTVLRDAGLQTKCLTCGADALSELASRSYDLLVCDLHMPDVSGRDVIGFAKRHHPNIRVLLLSGDNTGERAKNVAEATGVGYLPKPFTIRELLDAVSQVSA